MKLFIIFPKLVTHRFAFETPVVVGFQFRAT
jgi:hypothetical protein